MRIASHLLFLISFLIYSNLSDAATNKVLQDEISNLKKNNSIQQPNHKPYLTLYKI